jgi:hypothetical protein
MVLAREASWNRYDIPLLLIFPILTIITCAILLAWRRRSELPWDEQPSILGIAILGVFASVMAAGLVHDAHGVGWFECWMSGAQCGPQD